MHTLQDRTVNSVSTIAETIRGKQTVIFIELRSNEQIPSYSLLCALRLLFVVPLNDFVLLYPLLGPELELKFPEEHIFVSDILL